MLGFFELRVADGNPLYSQRLRHKPVRRHCNCYHPIWNDYVASDLSALPHRTVLERNAFLRKVPFMDIFFASRFARGVFVCAFTTCSFSLGQPVFSRKTNIMIKKLKHAVFVVSTTTCAEFIIRNSVTTPAL